MEFINVNSFKDIQDIAQDEKILLFYKKGTPNSDCAFQNLSLVNDGKVLLIDVNTVRDVHTYYSINTVPSMVIVKDGEVQNVVKGCQSANYYDQVIHKKSVSYGSASTDKPQKLVTVYTTPSCTFCNKLKQYFNKHGVKYTEINVAANQQAATEMAQKSGQRGVPQTNINGQIIVGFDVSKLSKLLNIPTE